MEDIARTALAAARSTAGGFGPARARRVAGSAAFRATSGGYSGARPDARDPARIGVLVRDLLTDRGWDQAAAAAGVVGRWEEIVGPDIAGHAQPEDLRDGELVLAAESSAWATQLRLLQSTIMARIVSEVGSGVVRRIRVHGPTAPSWRRGPRRVAGRGPRDTYG